MLVLGVSSINISLSILFLICWDCESVWVWPITTPEPLIIYFTIKLKSLYNVSVVVVNVVSLRKILTIPPIGAGLEVTVTLCQSIKLSPVGIAT